MIRAFLRDSVIYGLATILSRALAILTVPLYTRMLSAADYGVLDLIISLGVLVNLVVPLEVGQGLARLWGEQSTREAKRRLAGTAFWFSAGMYVLFIGGGLLLSPQLNSLLQFEERHLPALQAGVVLVACNGLFFSLQGQFRWELRSQEFAWTSLLYAVLLVALGVLLGLRFGLVGVLWGQALAAVVMSIATYWRLSGSLAFAVAPELLRVLLAFSWPLALSGMATYLSLHANRLILNSLTSLEEVGLYAVGYRVASLSALLVVGVQAALTPLIYAHHQEPETPRRLVLIFSAFVGVALVSCLGIGLFAPELMRLFAPVAFAPAASLVAVLAPSVLLSQMYVFAPGIALAKKTHWQLAIFLASAITCIGLSYLLIPALGAVGAAWSALGASAVFFALWLVISQRWYPLSFPWWRLLLASTGFVLCLLAGGLASGLSFWPGLLLRAGLIGALAALVLVVGLVDARRLLAILAERARATR